MGHDAIRGRNPAPPALSALLLLGCAAWPAAADVTCTQSSSRGSVSITIESPEPGAVLTDCGRSTTISGTWSSTQPPRDFDFFVVIDVSGSTDADSGVDVNGDGFIGGEPDTILRAELAAAEALVAALPARSRVAIITFSTNATISKQLTDDLPAVLSWIRGAAGMRSGGATNYTGAMDAVLSQLPPPDPMRAPRCEFLSDGAPSDSLTAIEAKAAELGARGVAIDTYALGTGFSQPLQRMASISGGRFTALATPGEIVAELPAALGNVYEFTYSAGAATGLVVPESDGTFTTTVPVTAGANHVELTLSLGEPAAVTVTCAIDFATGEMSIPEASVAAPACEGSTILLDGTATVSTCASTIYRWLDCNGVEVCPPSTEPTCVVTCGSCTRYTLESYCAGGTCTLTDVAVGACIALPRIPIPNVTRSCNLVTVVTCGVPPTHGLFYWDLDTLVDSNGDGDPVHDPDLSGCTTTIPLTAPGLLSLQSWAENQCGRVSAPLVVDVKQTPTLNAAAGPDQLICGGQTARLDGSASTVSSGTPTYRWLDCIGLEVAPVSLSPIIDVSPCDFCMLYTLELSTVEYPACVSRDAMVVTCTAPPRPLPTVDTRCGLQVGLDCHITPATGVSVGWDLDATVDSDGNGQPADDPDVLGCAVDGTVPTGGHHDIACWTRDGACTTIVPVEFDVSAPETIAEAGAPRSACRPWPLTLDGSASTTTAGSLEYQWSSCFNVLRNWSRDPTITVTCIPNCSYYRLEVRSTAEPSCVFEDTVDVGCTIAPPTVAPAYLGPCGDDRARVTCGAGSGPGTMGWDLAPGIDSDADGDPMNDPDLLGCDQVLPMTPGRTRVASWSRNGDCAHVQPLDIDFWPPSPRSVDGGACVGHDITLTCGTVAAGATAWWDLDARSDLDGDGDPENDREAPGCDVSFVGVAGSVDVRGWIEDAPGCARLVATGTLDIASSPRPGEVSGLRVEQRLGAGDDGAAWLAWDLAPDANEYRVLRGTMDELWTARAYDHRADPALGIGACSILAPSFMAAGERVATGSYYYLVTAVTDCGGEGPTGRAWTQAAQPDRPARVPTASCP